MIEMELTKRKALWAEAKCDEASSSDKPWAMSNLRLYQNLASKFWDEHFQAVKLFENGFK